MVGRLDACVTKALGRPDPYMAPIVKRHRDNAAGNYGDEKTDFGVPAQTTPFDGNLGEAAPTRIGGDVFAFEQRRRAEQRSQIGGRRDRRRKIDFVGLGRQGGLRFAVRCTWFVLASLPLVKVCTAPANAPSAALNGCPARRPAFR
jgi:hypothetical protein